MATPILQTERLELAPMRLADAAEMAGVLADPVLYRYTGGEPPSLDALSVRFAHLATGHSSDGTQVWHNWIVRQIAERSAVGTVQATVAAAEPVAEIAWVIGVPWQGRGYASEAARALVAWLEATGVTTITAHIYPGHVASESVASHAGLVATEEMEDGERVWRRVSPGPPATATAGG